MADCITKEPVIPLVDNYDSSLHEFVMEAISQILGKRCHRLAGLTSIRARQ
ncbi:MAG: hypothetical protein HY508_14770 [Acidobacteria bacterium]|nr:hypothetical protein [Acidobacteriota bacterium]